MHNAEILYTGQSPQIISESFQPFCI